MKGGLKPCYFIDMSSYELSGGYKGFNTPMFSNAKTIYPSDNGVPTIA